MENKSYCESSTQSKINSKKRPRRRKPSPVFKVDEETVTNGIIGDCCPIPNETSENEVISNNNSSSSLCDEDSILSHYVLSNVLNRKKMKRQTDGTALTSSLTKNLSSLALSDNLPLPLKKVVAQPNELVARSSGSPVLSVYSNSESPLTVPTPPLNSSPTPVIPTYQENVGGTTYFYTAPTTAEVAPSPSDELYTPIAKPMPIQAQAVSSPVVDNEDDSYFLSTQLRLEIQHKNNLTLMSSDPSLYPDLPLEVDNYHELVPLEPHPSLPSLNKSPIIPYQCSTYKATHVKTGQPFCLRRIHGFRHTHSKSMMLVDMWKKLSHSNIVQLREVFTTKAFGDQSLVFAYDYYPDSETLLSKYFSQAEILNGYNDSFSSNPNAPRPYSHQKNAILRQQHSSGMLPEPTIWGYVIQLTGALCVIHSAGLAARSLDPSKVILTGRNRVRISGAGVIDVLTFDPNNSNPLLVIPHFQQEDLNSLGKLVLALACRSLMASQRDNLQTSLDLLSRTYSSDLRNLVIFLLSNQQRRSVVDLMPMIGARFYSQLDSVQTQNDLLYHELSKEMDNGRLLRLMVKLGTVNERPELNLDPSWSETGDRYMLKLFRDHVFHQVTEEGRPFLDMAHVVYCLNKLDAGTQDKVCLMSRDEQSILVVTYAELKQCLEQSFAEIVAASVIKTDVVQ